MTLFELLMVIIIHKRLWKCKKKVKSVAEFTTLFKALFLDIARLES